MMVARVVLPMPGGPQSIIEGMWPDSISVRSTAPLPTRCCWPIYSSRFRGRSISAKGVIVVVLFVGIWSCVNQRLCLLVFVFVKRYDFAVLELNFNGVVFFELSSRFVRGLFVLDLFGKRLSWFF